MNKKFVYQVGNNKKSYTMMHGQPNIKIFIRRLIIPHHIICATESHVKRNIKINK